MTEYCVVHRTDRVWEITIDRSEVLNALHPPANAEISEIFDGFSADPTAQVAILTGAGQRAFCAGNDLKYQAAGGDMSIQPPTGMAGLTKRFNLDKPVIAAVNGLAFGGGFEIILAADLAVLADHAVLALPETRVGLVAQSGVHRLTRAVGHKRAMEVLLAGRHLDASAALEMGLCNAVVPAGDVLDEARRLAQEIAACAPLATRATKQAACEGLEHGGPRSALSASYALVEATRRSHDAIEGAAAFAEGRAPRWSGS